MKGFIRPPDVFKSAVGLEHCLADAIGLQERNGIWIDKVLANESIMDLEGKIDAIQSELEPQLPLLIDMVDTKVKGEAFTHGVKKPFTKTGFTKTVLGWFANEGEVVKEYGAKRKDGTKPERTYVYPGVAQTEYDIEDVVVGPFCRVGWFKMELSSSSQVSEFLLSQGWQPTEYNLKKVTKNEAEDPKNPYFGQVVGKPARDRDGGEVFTTPKLTEDSFDTIEGELGKQIATFRTYKHRKGFIEGILRAVDDRGRVGQGAVTLGAITSRMQHRTIVNTPRASSTYGTPCREIFHCKEPYWNFGADLSGLEDRMKAHYTYPVPGGKAYAAKILDPAYDVHEENMAMWGVPKTKAKPGAYALAYNCGYKKLAKTLGVAPDVGQQHYDSYWSKNRPLKLFNDKVVDEYKERKRENGKGWVLGLDGRVLFPRSPHSAANTLFQSAGNIVAKTAVCIMRSWANRNNIDGWQWSFNHDEYQWAVHEKHIDEFYWFDDKEAAVEFSGKSNNDSKGFYFSNPSCIDGRWLVVESRVCNAMIQSFLAAGRKYGIKVPTTGECLVGRNWAQCH